MLFLSRARMLFRVLLSCDLAIIGATKDRFLFHVSHRDGIRRLLIVEWFLSGLGGEYTLAGEGHTWLQLETGNSLKTSLTWLG